MQAVRGNVLTSSAGAFDTNARRKNVWSKTVASLTNTTTKITLGIDKYRAIAAANLRSGTASKRMAGTASHPRRELAITLS
jgi:hypothetical protein